MVISGPCPVEALRLWNELDNPGTPESAGLSLKNYPFLEIETVAFQEGW
jgi:hypothetical protein